MKIRDSKGFTLIELVLVIAILGILAVTALPKFMDLSTEAKQSSRDGVIGAVRSGIALYRANDMVTNGGTGSYPASLDANADASACATCFSTILANGISDSSWTRTNATTYTYNDGTTTTTYTYSSANGTFQ
ncbi:MAG: prepilin-type N-terminal cleavage/methylation domain-containing protein [Deltaproteobacteria bacterium]|nr:prepilin-type N-terminal cleavage/methylation domain-containing protein [Deltaproteobacteria bacterium]